MKTFNPGDYIVTSCGFRGYVIKQIEKTNFYEVRLAGGVTVRSAQDLEHDALMLEE